ncbi:serine/threonine-protein kinase-like protein [Grosmannia clavigera kw1407]|uniref:Serine/threonine-protein kinase-like protein n=1 Tax=Grosmannia clavigera (strain kw1407 / UAMH 11150) TaxID=655863 RepID=F0XGC2_GROCL|nr:serine/threonine-protein kinase-like protein [Grosmannia clavigera kw1407]EFX02821.1 serine/threonine-protein kinase-like protein [Grosmannia clavigera kw1407]
MGNGQGKLSDVTGEVNLNHFRLLRVVGRGAFGKVRIVERKDTGLSFALKYIRKDEVVRSESVRNIIRERRMLEHVNHPFICNLRYSFQDIEYMYLVVDLMSGGDLRFHISRKTFTEDANVASDIVPGRVMTSKSGTLAYLAPEVYSGRGYDIRADWWSLGVLFYECIYNKRPFEGTSESSLGNVVQAANPRFPITSPPVTLPCLYAIRSALSLDPSNRLGNTWDSFIYHDFFAMIDFEALERKEIEPVFIPSADKTNFDATYDLEELLLEEAPLEARARRQKPRERLKDDATDKEIREDELYRMIDRDFRPFDYTVAAYKKLTEQAAAQQNGQQNGPFAGNGSSASTPQPQAITTDQALPATRIGGIADGDTSGASVASTSPPIRSGADRDGQSISSQQPRRQPGAPPGRPPPVPPPLAPYANPYTNSARNSNYRPLRNLGSVSVPNGSVVLGSPTGGVQVRLDGHNTVGSSWSELARQDATLPTDAAAGGLLGVDDGSGGKADGSSSSGGVFGFLSRKKGRGNSPKPKERGVLGKEGARVVIG